MFIYKMTNLINGKRYIGQTTGTLKRRLLTHKYGKTRVGNAVRKYGPENFKIELVCKAVDQSELNAREISTIRLFKTLLPNGYNVALGGNRSKRIASPMKGKKHSEATKLKMSLAAKNKPKSKESVLKMIASKKGVRPSAEAVTKRIAARIGKSIKGRSVIDLSTNRIFKSVTEASKETGIPRRTLNRKLSNNNSSIQYLKEIT
jgi:group I intron endonuclease